MKKRWVFASLVKNDQDAIGLIAYALYKHKKHTLATSLRSEGKDETFIQQQVDTFHDQTLQNNSLDDFREKATKFLDEMIGQIEKDLTADHEKEKAALAKQHKNQLTNEQKRLLQNMKNYQRAHRSIWERAGAWILSGVPSAVSSFLIASLVIGASVLTVSEEQRQAVLTSLWANYFGVNEPPRPPAASP
ncbi:hypothetical protein KEM63_01790 [Halopseudomonas nanhaiensis]|uniref:hypothetical protein n=1 Tax=Halopseudomonas nanhaiensis TaxID=2830842 RepID=UPI001CBFCEF9|nr:hypothetical protein [Halopseudomonas nanhaiensis]UAW98743.1 hypothetical protein KEM63_01790 [Halopseudomonas nanhaiensis]